MKPALEKFLIIAATLAAIGLFVFVAMWSSIKDKKTQMDDLFNNTNVPTSFYETPVENSMDWHARLPA
jgi:FtsZ-interacting cell division protein ZipA